MAKNEKLEITFGWNAWLMMVLAGYAVFVLVWLTMGALSGLMGWLRPVD